MKLEDPNDKELAWIADNVARANAATLADLDRLWADESAKIRAAGGDPNALVNMVGLALGQHLVAVLGLRWVIATDEYGTELALHGDPGNILLYPCNLVAKRWQSGETEFLVSVGGQIIRDLGALRPPKP